MSASFIFSRRTVQFTNVSGTLFSIGSVKPSQSIEATFTCQGLSCVKSDNDDRGFEFLVMARCVTL